MASSSPSTGPAPAIPSGPAASLPPGIGLERSESGSLLIAGRAIVLVLSIVSTIFVAIRVYTKIFIVRRMRKSDYAMIFAWALVMGFMAPVWLYNDASPGVEYITLNDMLQALYYYIVGATISSICCFFVKLSILLQLVEIFARTRDWFYWTCYGLVAANFVFYTVGACLMLACRLTPGRWQSFLLTGQCMNARMMNVINSSINAASDLIILALPQFRIWRLQMPLRKKIGVSAIFLLGLFACACAILRLAYGIILLSETSNRVYWLAGVWVVPELTAGIIAGCLPSFAKYVRHILSTGRATQLGSSFRHLWTTATGRGHPSASKGVSAGTFVEVMGVAAVVAPKASKTPDPHPLTSWASEQSTVDGRDTDYYRGP
ncbi:uncharacterized protein BO97DRAFT_423558 [Aspergillus homomorphus CBS 101889]|uniref:Rhodopsin domain-containing protein n=1 Tax=Aspergillus homomorphus (strain CBS 101889) TaxID=1450537 RepID=A0A395HZX2_ASPHC|nr:hypothetical protein BO97DRAFT_423558 [Aspergillus homomorphus CBS 101889]RAL13350.1 hypothetical protein BO97DRAFT_423558 [Aspergillus homomorphus CBS 101889]